MGTVVLDHNGRRTSPASGKGDRPSTTSTRDNYEQCDSKRRRHRIERPAPSVGRLPGHSRHRHRLRHSRRHPGHLGRRVRFYRRATRRDRRRWSHRLLLRRHHRRSRRGQDRLRQTDRGGVSVPPAVGIRDVCRDEGAGPGHGLHVPVSWDVHLLAGERHARSRGQSARLDALSEEPHALLEHSPRELAGRARHRRPHRMDSRRGHARQLEDAARAVPRADRALRLRVLRPEVPEIRSLRQGPQRR